MENITLQIEPAVKEQAEALFSELGLNLSTAFNIFLRQSIWEQGIPFTISRCEPNAETLAAMAAAEREEELYGPFDSAEAVMEALNA